MGANLAAGKGAAARMQCMYVDSPCGERCCSKNAMHVCGQPLLVLECFHLILFILLIGKKYFEN